MKPELSSNAECALELLSPADAQVLSQRIVEFNSSQVPFTQSPPFTPIAYGFKDDRGNLLAGITATVYCWRVLGIDVLWVSEAHRGKGWGSKLLDAVENEARRRGCGLAHLDTFDFQAKSFYVKHGYEIFGELDNCPPGHKRFFFKKVI
ncbi:MAG TPA: GNAT family N-acetyltransferase [Candidatus Cybelea sp.]